MVPIKAEASVEGAFPVDSKGVVILEGDDEMESVIFWEILDSEIVDTEYECCAFGVVLKEARSERGMGS